jgi:transposase
MPLNLPSVTVSRIEEKNDRDYHVYAIPSSEPQSCLGCESTALYGHGTKTTLYMDMPMHGHRVGILLKRKRYKCRSCGITFVQRCDDINDKHRATNRLVSYVENHGLTKTAAVTCKRLALGQRLAAFAIARRNTALICLGDCWLKALTTEASTAGLNSPWQL